MGHSRIDTTQRYTDDIELDELAAALDRAAAARDAQASPELATLETEVSGELRKPGVEAAGIEPASADAPDRASTSVGRPLDSPGGWCATDLPPG